MNDTLILSEVAGRLELDVSAADSAQTIADRIVSKFDEYKALELSEREQNAVLVAREVKIDRLKDYGVPPVICNQIKQMTCGDALALSEDENKVGQWIDLFGEFAKHKVLKLSERTKAQVEAETLANDPQAQWAERTKNLQPI